MRKFVKVGIVILVIALIVFLGVQQIANHRRGTAIEKYLDAMRTVLLRHGVNEDSIVYDKGCTRSISGFGYTEKHCSRSIKIDKSGTDIGYAREMIHDIVDTMRKYQGMSIGNVDNVDLEKIDREKGAAMSLMSGRIDGYVQCSVFARYLTPKSEAFRIAETDIGNTYVNFGCDDTSWWLRLDIF